MSDLPAAGSLRVKVAFDPKERHGALWAANRLGPLWRRPAVMLPVIAVAAGLVGWGQTVLPRRVHWGVVSGVGDVLAALTGVGLFVYALKLRRRFQEETESHEQHPDVYTLNEDGLEISGADDLALMSWSGMTRVHETDRFFLFVAGSEVQYLPKRALDAAQVDVVRGLVLRHGPATGRQLPSPQP